MMRRFLFSFRRETGVKAVLVFFAVLGAASSVAQFFPRMQAWATTIVGTLGGAAIAYAWRHSRTPAIPAEEILPLSGAVPHKAGLSLELVSSGPALSQVHALTCEVYPDVTPIPVDRYLQFLRVNPTIFACLFDRNRQVLGYFDVFPLAEDMLAKLLNGEAGESDVRASHILARDDALMLPNLYLGGIAVRDVHRHTGRRAASILVWGLVQYMADLYPLPPARNVYAEAATPEGESLLRSFGFQFVADRTGRTDPFPMYKLSLDAQRYREITHHLADWSNCVELGWRRKEVVSRPTNVPKEGRARSVSVSRPARRRARRSGAR